MRRPPTLPLLAVATLAVAVSWPGEAFAQRRRGQGGTLPQPHLQSLLPVGVEAGSTADVTVRGSDLEGVTTLWFDHPGLRAFHLKGLTFRVVAAPGTPPGHHDVRAVGTYGVSNPRTFVVGDRPQTLEVEPNNTPAQAGETAVNRVVQGEVGGAVDVDCFAFDGKKGQRVLFDLEAERVDSRLDATLRLLDPSGREVAESRDAFGGDPFLDVTLPADGRYVAKVHDVTYRGSNEYPYRLTITDGPHVDAVEPALARPGQSGTFTLIGRNLGGTPAPDRAPDGRPLERKTVTITAPASPEPDPVFPTRGHVASAAATRRGFEYALETLAGRSNPVFIALADDPVVTEREPNDDDAHAQEVSLPCDVSGRFGAPGDVDVYRFKAKKGDVWWVEAMAERLGSPADPTFVIRRVNAKGDPTDLMTGDDLADKGGQTRFNTGSLDAAVRWQVPDDGEYQVVVSDLYGAQRGDVSLAYRLNVRPERRDFLLFLLPESPNQPDALTLNAGGRSLAYVLAWRADGLDAPVRVEPADLPPGVTCAPVIIPGNQAVAPVVFEAAADAPASLGTVRLLGKAVAPEANGTSPVPSHEALAGAVVWPPENAGQANSLALARLTRGFVVKVVGPAPLALNVTPAAKVTTPGSVLALELGVDRREGFTEAVAVTLLNPLSGMAAPPAVTVAKGAAKGTFAANLPRTLAPGVYTLVFQGAGPFPFSKDPNAKNRPNVNLSEPSNPVTVTVRPAPLSLSVSAKEKTVKAGGSLALTVSVKPKDGVKGPFTVSLAAPSSLKLTAEPVKAEADKPVTLTLKAAADSPVGAAAGVSVHAAAAVNGEDVPVDEPFAVTVAK